MAMSTKKGSMATISRSVGISRAGLNGFFNLMKGLDASANDMGTLLAVSERTIRRYQDGGRSLDLDHDTLERISHILTIWLDLMSIFRTQHDALRWLKAPNVAFGERSPWERMLAGNVSDLVDVRYHIQAALAA